MPLVYQAFNWVHGVYVGATMASETTAAAVGKLGEVRRDPMAMLPFCGYHMGDYFEHWLDMRRRLSSTRRASSTSTGSARTATGNSLARLRREHARAQVDRRPLPRPRRRRRNAARLDAPPRQTFDLDGLTDFPPEKFERVQDITDDEWRREILMQDELFLKLHARLPKELIFQRELLLARL